MASWFVRIRVRQAPLIDKRASLCSRTRRERRRPSARRADRSRRAGRPNPRRTAPHQHRQHDQIEEPDAPSPAGDPGANAGSRALFRRTRQTPLNTWPTASAWRSRAMRLTLVARSGNRRASATATRISPIVSGDRTRVKMTRRRGLAAAPRWSRAGAGNRLEIRVPAHKALDDGGEQRLLAGKSARRSSVFRRRRPRRFHRCSRR